MVHVIAAAKAMLMVFRSIKGDILIQRLPRGERFNSGYFCEKILEPLSEILLGRRAARSARPILHFDNAARHRSVKADQRLMAFPQNCNERFPLTKATAASQKHCKQIYLTLKSSKNLAYSPGKWVMP
jgi:hypothetical protein